MIYYNYKLQQSLALYNRNSGGQRESTSRVQPTVPKIRINQWPTIGVSQKYSELSVQLTLSRRIHCKQNENGRKERRTKERGEIRILKAQRKSEAGVCIWKTRHETTNITRLICVHV